MEMDSRPDNLVVSEYVSVDEAIPIDFRKEQCTEAYKETMSKYIDNIDTYETITKFNTTKWRPIYEVIDEAYIKETKFFAGDFIKGCKKNQTKHNIYRTR